MTQAQRAFIFDMDGTIVDNMAFHTESWLAFFARRGKTYDPDAFFRETAGAQAREILRERLDAAIPDDEIAVLAQEKDVLYRDIYAPHRAAIRGFEAFVTQAVIDGAVGEEVAWPGSQQLDHLVLTDGETEIDTVPKGLRVVEREVAAG